MIFRRLRRRRRRLDGVVVSSPTSPNSNKTIRVATCPSPEHVIVVNKIPEVSQSRETKI